MATYTEPQRISGPTELLQAIPYLLGFHPRRSLVLVGLAGTRLVVTARLDLDDAADAALVRHTVQTLARGGSTEIVGALFDDPGPREMARRWSVVTANLEHAAEHAGCAVSDVLVAGAGRWRSVSCRADDCCPPDGRPFPTEPSAFAAAATVAGVVALPDRRALEQSLDPLPDDERARLAPLVDLAEHEFAIAVLSNEVISLIRAEKRALFAAARRADEAEWDGIDDEGVARFGAALKGSRLRDSLWMAVDGGRVDGRPLWRELARRLPTPYDAPGLFLYGWAAWRAGDGALAAIAAERTVASDPTYTAADLLIAALSHGVDPRRLPRLRQRRPA